MSNRALSLDRNGFVTHYTYDANGNVIETKDALGGKAFFEYDSMDRLSKVTLNRVDMQDFVNTNEITLYEYDKRGLTTKEIGTTGLETLYVYDENGNLVQKTDADGYIAVNSNRLKPGSSRMAPSDRLHRAQTGIGAQPYTRTKKETSPQRSTTATAGASCSATTPTGNLSP
jgi:YD repeat-containing protein